ncbi:MAG TPA: NifU family protein [Verrucomicrobiaceae bacterium]|jgi:Fe-S cluster biogenesis protein NfuA/nitrite reductase/ring-hydroxylating ferredoxin subunit
MNPGDTIGEEPAVLMRRIQQFVDQVEQHPNPQTRESMRQCLEAVVEIYGTGLTRIVQLVNGNDSLRQRLADDDVVRGLLLIHGLHPVPLETRLRQALEQVRPYLQSHGGNVDLVDCSHGVARLRLEGHCKTCPSSSVTLELAIRQAIDEACPDLDRIEVEGAPQAMKPRFVIPDGAPAWHVLGREEDFNGDGMAALQVDGSDVLLCRVNGLRYAYLNHCPACSAALDGGLLEGEILACPRGHRFNIRRAGASADQSGLHLDPLPLVAADGMIKIAIQPTVKKEAA